jgi:hypothetical protein
MTNYHPTVLDPSFRTDHSNTNCNGTVTEYTPTQTVTVPLHSSTNRNTNRNGVHSNINRNGATSFASQEEDLQGRIATFASIPTSRTSTFSIPSDIPPLEALEIFTAPRRAGCGVRTHAPLSAGAVLGLVRGLVVVKAEANVDTLIDTPKAEPAVETLLEEWTTVDLCAFNNMCASSREVRSKTVTTVQHLWHEWWDNCENCVTLVARVVCQLRQLCNTCGAGGVTAVTIL